MTGSGTPFTSQLKERAFAMLELHSEVVDFHTDNHLASLCTCIGLHEELGEPDYDRLSPFFGIDPSSYAENPWRSELVFQEGQIGIRFRLKKDRPLGAKHPDLRYLLHPDSLQDQVHQGPALGQILIFPERIAKYYAGIGLELVIVKDWLLRGRGGGKVAQQHAFNYLQANIHEIEANTARLQCEMLLKRQLAFSGTHDLVDHLFGFDVQGFSLVKDLCVRIKKAFHLFFSKERRANRNLLILSYLLGIILDDLVQPVWYGSKSHFRLADLALAEMYRIHNRPSDSLNLELNDFFAELVMNMRSPTMAGGVLAQSLSRFLSK